MSAQNAALSAKAAALHCAGAAICNGFQGWTEHLGSDRDLGATLGTVKGPIR